MNRIDKLKSKIHLLIRRLPGQRGNTLAYIATVLIIFGVIGVAMISLLTSSVTSSASPNLSRRAQYMSEAGVRYATSELRNNDFDSDVVDDLNNWEYVLSTGDKFELDVFSLWLRSPSDDSDAQITGNIEEGIIPANFSMDTGNIYAVNIESAPDSFGNLIIPPAGVSTSTALIQSFTKTDTSMTLDLNDDFQVNKDDRVCLAVHPLASQSPNVGDSLEVHADARFIFPKHDGAVYITDKLVYYDQAIYHDGDPAKLELTKLSDDVTVDADTTDDYVILWPSNHLITSTGTSESVSQGAYPESSVNIYDPDGLTSGKKGAPAADLNLKDMILEGEQKDISINESNSGFITAEDDTKTLDIGSGQSAAAFGAVWYDENKSIGGQTNYCTAGACLFGPGVRVFFTLKYSGDGDGLTFALISAGGALPPNTADSVGGDVELSELLGYAGDSRIVADPIAGSDYLDGVGNGLLAPKIAVEFDMQTNGDPVDYCVDINTIRQNTRKDPLSGDKDAVQYVYWGNTILDIDCRGDHPSYDDNRHNAEVGAGSSDWEYDANAPVFSSPALDPGDGTIYFGSGSSDYPTGDFHAVHPDGTEKWVIKKGNYVKSSPAVGSDGTIYFGSNKFYAIKPDGTEKWPPHTLDGSVSASPAIAADGTIYIGSNGSNDAKLYAFNPDGTEAWNFPLDGAGDGDNDIDSPIIVDNAGGGTIYVGSDNDFLYAVNPDGTLKWKFDTGADVESGAAVDRTGGPHDGTTYVGSENGLFYGIQPDGTEKWVHNLGGAVFSTPAVGADGTIYVGSNSNKLYALNPATHIPDWEFLTGGDVRSSPTIGPSGTIYFGSHDNKLYAVNPDGIEIWQFVTFGDVVTKPALKEDGTIYIGVANESTVEGKLYSISDIASPPNFRNLLITSTGVNPNFQVGGEDVKLDDPDDWLAGESLKGPWAVRMEIKRSLTANNGRYEYTLRTWIRQCATVIASSECDDPSIIGTFFQDTRLEYDAKPPHLTQTIELDLADHVLFERFLFGFTGASGAGVSQNAVIEKLQLSFIRPGDPVVTTDTNW